MKRGMNCFLADQCSDRLMGCGIAAALRHFHILP